MSGGSIPTEQVARIAEVLEDHSALENWRECSCGKWRAWTSEGPNGCYEEHVAAALVDALGLTEEWGWRLGDYEPSRYPDKAAAQARVDDLNELFRAQPHGSRYSSQPRTVVSRLVGPWVPSVDRSTE